jgi:hypothetical protein
MTAPLDRFDRELLMRCPLTEVIPQSTKGISSDLSRRIAQVGRLKKDGLIRVEIDVDCSDARHITRKIHLTPAGVAALHE